MTICEKCQGTMAYDPYFSSHVCRQCGNHKAFPVCSFCDRYITNEEDYGVCVSLGNKNPIFCKSCWNEFAEIVKLALLQEEK